MIKLSTNQIIEDFFSDIGLALPEDLINTLKTMVLGIVVNESGTIRNISNNTIDGPNSRKLNRDFYKLAGNNHSILEEVFSKMQTTPGLAIKPDGVTSLDEHIIRKTGKEIEGVDYFYSTADNKSVLGLSMISTHYYGGRIEYPIDFKIYRKFEDLEKYKKTSDYKKKNEIARDLISSSIKSGHYTKYWAVDSYFLTKDNVKEFKSHNLSYVSKIKRNWKCTYMGMHYTITELHDSIPSAEYRMVKVKSPKTGKYRYFQVANRNVFISKIGTHLLLFIKEYEMDDSDVLVEKYKDDWICLISNILTKPPEEIIDIYMKRWAIETSYRDDTQQLKLSGCMLRDIEGQYCYIVLVFIAYILLVWAWYNEYLDPFNSDLRTLGQRRAAFKRISDELFSEWISDLKKRCENCTMAKIIYELIYRGDKASSFYKEAIIT